MCVLIGSVFIVIGAIWNALCTDAVQFMVCEYSKEEKWAVLCRSLCGHPLPPPHLFFYFGSLTQICAARVVLGIGGSITKVGAPPLLQETAHPRLRANLGHMYYGFYYVGSLFSAICCSQSTFSKFFSNRKT